MYGQFREFPGSFEVGNQPYGVDSELKGVEGFARVRHVKTLAAGTAINPEALNVAHQDDLQRCSMKSICQGKFRVNLLQPIP